MDVIESENIKVPNALIISGLSNTVVDEEIIDYLKQYGSIARIIKVPEPSSSTPKQLIVEFKSGEAVEALENVLPLDRPSDTNSEVIHHVEALSNVFSCNKGTGITHTFLSSLKNVAKLSGKSFEDVLRYELTRITEAVGEQIQEEVTVAGESTPTMQQGNPAVISPQIGGTKRDSALLMSDHLLRESSHTPQADVALASGDSTPSFKLSSDHISPPEVQRVVVEHIVKSTEFATHSAKLRPFSGRIPCPNFEVDYESWRSSVEFHIADLTIPRNQLVRKIVDSLLPPAVNVVKTLGPHATPRAYLDLLDSAYATVEDGDELFAKFLSINQNSGEKPSNYLHRLQTVLSKAVKMKAISIDDADKQLLKQFCRGCWNNNLITTLQLEHKKDQPPNFSELLLLLRVEEDKQIAKANRMKQHLGFTKPKAQSQVHNVCFPEEDESDSPVPASARPSAIKQLQKQIVDLQAQIAALSLLKDGKTDKSKAAKKKTNPKEELVKYTAPPPAQPPAAAKRPKPWYCFRCGEDGHIASSCSSSPNPTLVDDKRKQLKEKQQDWEKHHTTGNSSTLN